MAKRTVIKGPTRVCSSEYGVTRMTVTGGKRHVARVQPCEQCPWRKDVPPGVFPPDAYRESAPTSYDASFSTFACHMSGTETVATCAGFLVRHALHNMSVRLSLSGERIDLDKITDGGHPLYESYREMAIANGVPADDPVLAPVRGLNDEWDTQARRWAPRKRGR